MVMRGRPTNTADLIARIKKLEEQLRALQTVVAAMPKPPRGQPG